MQDLRLRRQKRRQHERSCGVPYLVGLTPQLLGYRRDRIDLAVDLSHGLRESMTQVGTAVNGHFFGFFAFLDFSSGSTATEKTFGLSLTRWA